MKLTQYEIKTKVVEFNRLLEEYGHNQTFMEDLETMLEDTIQNLFNSMGARVLKMTRLKQVEFLTHMGIDVLGKVDSIVEDQKITLASLGQPYLSRTMSTFEKTVATISHFGSSSDFLDDLDSMLDEEIGIIYDDRADQISKLPVNHQFYFLLKATPINVLHEVQKLVPARNSALAVYQQDEG